MDRRHREPLAGATLADEQRRDAVGGEAANQFVDVEHRRSGADQADRRRVGGLGRCRADRRGNLLRCERLRDRAAQIVEIERLGEVIEGAGADRVDRRLAAAVRPS